MPWKEFRACCFSHFCAQSIHMQHHPNLWRRVTDMQWFSAMHSRVSSLTSDLTIWILTLFLFGYFSGQKMANCVKIYKAIITRHSNFRFTLLLRCLWRIWIRMAGKRARILWHECLLILFSHTFISSEHLFYFYISFLTEYFR